MIPLRLSALAFAAGLALSCQSEPQVKLGPLDGLHLPPTDLERIQVGDTAPDFRLAAFGGGTVALSDYRGAKTVVLQFYRGHW